MDIHGTTSLNEGSMTPGTLCMYMLREIVTKGMYQDDTLEAKYHILQQQIPGKVPVAVHSRHLMQFELAANTLVGDSFSKETGAELATGQQGAPPRDARDHKKKRAEGNQGRRDPEEDRKRHRKFHNKRERK